MAKIEVSSTTGAPRCSGCGVELHYLPAVLDSRVRGTNFPKDACHLGSMGPQVAAFAEEHAACREPVVSQLSSGAVLVDRRGVRP